MPYVHATVVKPGLVHYRLQIAYVVVYSEPHETAGRGQKVAALLNTRSAFLDELRDAQTIAPVAKVFMQIVRRVSKDEIEHDSLANELIHENVAVNVIDSIELNHA